MKKNDNEMNERCLKEIKKIYKLREK